MWQRPAFWADYRGRCRGGSRGIEAAGGQDILIYGSVDLIASLMPHGLIDEFRLLIYPLVLGAGKRLFFDGIAANFQLAETQTFDSGVLALIYHPAPQA